MARTTRSDEGQALALVGLEDAGDQLRERVMRLLRGEANRDAGVLLATHDPEAAAVCDAELRLDEGVGTWVRDER
jgi:putative ABC transport system ATP-binding protein